MDPPPPLGEERMRRDASFQPAPYRRSQEEIPSIQALIPEKSNRWTGTIPRSQSTPTGILRFHVEKTVSYINIWLSYSNESAENHMQIFCCDVDFRHVEVNPRGVGLPRQGKDVQELFSLLKP